MNKNIYKNIFVNKYKQSKVVENCTHFLKKIKELKLYIIKL